MFDLHNPSRHRGLSPANLPGLQLWVDGPAITGLNDADPVHPWSDLSGNGNDALQTTAAKKPVYKLDIQNGLAIVRYDDVDDHHILTTSVSLPGDFGIFMAVDLRRDNMPLGNTGLNNYLDPLASGDLYIKNPTGAISHAMPFTDGEFAAVSIVRKDGVITVYKNAAQTDSNAQAGAFAFNVVGARGPVDNLLGGDFGELFIYSQAPQGSNLTSIHTYLERWGTI